MMKLLPPRLAVPSIQGRFQQSLVEFASALAITVGAVTPFMAVPASAAERLVLTYDPFRSSISIAEMRTLADTGEISPTIRAWLRLANVDADVFRRVLTEDVSLNQRIVDRAGNSRPGELLLREIGNSFHTRSRQSNVQALRGTLLVSTVDNRISLIEFLEKYPTSELFVNGRSLLVFVNDVNNVRDRVQAVVTTVETFLSDRLCNCAP